MPGVRFATTREAACLFVTLIDLDMLPPLQPAAPAAPRVDVAASARSGAGPADMLQAVRAQRSELRNQVDRLEDKRNELSGELMNDQTPVSSRPGIEARIKEIDARISATEQQVTAADLAVAQAAAVPGATVEPPRPIRTGPPDEIVAIPIVFTIFVLCPIAIAYARRIWRRGSTIIAPVPQEVRDRLDRMSEAVESIALEVERIGEGQRFMTKVMSESGRALGAGAAQPIQVAHAERVGVRREE